jgi:hypothetical protein
MKVFIIFAMALNVLLMTHSSKEEQVDMSLGAKRINNYISKNTDDDASEEYIQMVYQPVTKSEDKVENDTRVEESKTIQPEDIDFQLNSKSIGIQNIREMIKTRGSAEKYNVEDGKPRIFPLFTTFHHREETDVNDILIDLNEKQAIDLYLMSNLFRDTIDEYPGKDDNGYCQRTYGNDSPNFQQRVDACQRIRSIDFSKDSPYFSQVHSSHMKVIMKFVNTKDGVAPPEGYIKEVKNTGIQIGEGMSGENFDTNFVNTIWDKNNKDVGYILSAAMYLEIKSLSQLMGARIAQEIQTVCASSDEQDFLSLASITLENEFLVPQKN